MQLSELFTPALSFTSLESRSKKRLLETVSQKLTLLHPHLASDQVFDALIERERLGSTGLGEGVAVPHCRLEGLAEGGIGVLVQLQEPIDFDAPDMKKVDLLAFLLVSAEATQGHLDALAAIAAKLSDADMREAMRSAETPEKLYELMVSG